MNHYICIQLLSDAECDLAFIRNTLITKLHKVLYDLKAIDIGISFPKVVIKLGHVLRIHGTQERLQELQDKKWLGGLIGYCDVSEIKEIPQTGVSYRIVSRVQLKLTPAKLRRLIKRKNLSDEDIKAYKAKMFLQSLDLPYLELINSKGMIYRRYIEHGELKNSPTNGEFSQFGLSKNATIPWF